MPGSDAESRYGARGRRRYARLLRGFVTASALATVASQLVFLSSYGLGAPALVATILAWLVGASINFSINRRTWGSSGRNALRGELARFAVVSVGTAVLAALATIATESAAMRAFSESPGVQIMLVWGAFVGTYLVMFVVKFFLFDRLVFTSHRRPAHD